MKLNGTTHGLQTFYHPLTFVSLLLIVNLFLKIHESIRTKARRFCITFSWKQLKFSI